MKVWITRDSTGLIQMWKYKPKKIITAAGFIFADLEHNFIGIEVNSIFNEDTEKKVCCVERNII